MQVIFLVAACNARHVAGGSVDNVGVHLPFKPHLAVAVEQQGDAQIHADSVMDLPLPGNLQAPSCHSPRSVILTLHFVPRHRQLQVRRQDTPASRGCSRWAIPVEHQHALSWTIPASPAALRCSAGSRAMMSSLPEDWLPTSDEMCDGKHCQHRRHRAPQTLIREHMIHDRRAANIDCE